jgi:hypothetical protein
MRRPYRLQLPGPLRRAYVALNHVIEPPARCNIMYCLARVLWLPLHVSVPASRLEWSSLPLASKTRSILLVRRIAPR